MSVAARHQGAAAKATANHPPLNIQRVKSLPEAISLDNTPGKVFSTEESSGDDGEVRSNASRGSQASPYRISSEAVTPHHHPNTPSSPRSASATRPAAVKAGVVHEVSVVSEVHCEMDSPVTAPLDTPDRTPRHTKAGGPPLHEHPPAASASQKTRAPRPSPSSPSHAPRKTRTVVRPPLASVDSHTVRSAGAPFRPLHKDFAQPPSDLLSLRTRSSLPKDQSRSPKKSLLSAPSKPLSAAAVPRKTDASDMSSAARSNPHLSVLADLLDNKVFTEEDVLLELEAIRKRSLLTSAPFNRRLLPILAWYLLRDKFGDDAATRYVALLKSPLTPTANEAGAAGRGAPTPGVPAIPSFLPRVNAIRRDRRDAREQNRKDPQHHYAITPPTSPTDAGTVSSASSATRQQRRLTATFDVLEDASDIPTTTVSAATSSSSQQSPTTQLSSGSPGSRFFSPLPYDRLHVYTRDHAAVDRHEARAQDRTIVDVVVDTGSRRARAANEFEVVQADVSSSAGEPSIFQPPASATAPSPAPQRPSAAAAPAAQKPTPPASAPAKAALHAETAHQRLRLRTNSAALVEPAPSLGAISAVTAGADGEGGLSSFYHGDGGVGSGRPPAASVSAFWQAITPSDVLRKQGPADVAHPPPRRPGGSSPRDASMEPTLCVSSIMAKPEGDESEHHFSLPTDDATADLPEDASRLPRDVAPHPLHDGDAAGEYSYGTAALGDVSASGGGDQSTELADGSALRESTVVFSAVQDASSAARGYDARASLLREAQVSPSSSRDTPSPRGDTNSASPTATATDYYSMLPDASMATTKPDYSPRGQSTEPYEASSARLACSSTLMPPCGTAADTSAVGDGSLFQSHTDTPSDADAANINESVSPGTRPEYSAFNTADTCTLMGEQTSASADAAGYSAFDQKASRLPRTSHTARSSRDTSAASATSGSYSGFRSARTVVSKLQVSALSAARSSRRGTPAYSLFDSRATASDGHTGPRTDASAQGSVAHTGTSDFGSLMQSTVHHTSAPSALLTSGAAPSVISGDPSGYPYSICDANAEPSSACIRVAPADPSDASSHHTAQRTTGDYGSLFQSSAVSPSPAAQSNRRRGGSRDDAGRTSGVAVRRSLSAEFTASRLHSSGHGSTFTADRDTQVNTSESVAEDKSESRTGSESRLGLGSVVGDASALGPNASAASQSNGGYSFAARSESRTGTESRLGLGSVVGDASALGPNASAASQSNGGYSFAARSESRTGTESRLGLGSVVGDASALGPNASAASQSNGGYSFAARSESRTGTESRLGLGSVVGDASALGPNASAASQSNGGYSFAARSESRTGTESDLSTARGDSYCRSLSGTRAAVGELSGSSGGYDLGMSAISAMDSRVNGSVAKDRSVNSAKASPIGMGSLTQSNGGYSLLVPRSGTASVVADTEVAGRQDEHSASSDMGHYGFGESSSMDVSQLQHALARLAETDVSGIPENAACTFGEPGCRCATGQCRHRTAATAPSAKAACLSPALPVPPTDAAARTQRFDRSALKASPIEAAVSHSSPDPAVPLEPSLTERAVHSTSTSTSNSRRSRVPSAGTGPRTSNTPLRVGTGFRQHASTSPAGPRETSPRRSPHRRTATPALPRKAEAPAKSPEADVSHVNSILDTGVGASHVTILTDPRDSMELSVHNLPGESTLAGDTSVRQLHDRQRTNTDTPGRPAPDPAASTAAPISILQNSPCGSRLNESKAPALPSRMRLAPSLADGASAVGGLSVIVGPTVATTRAATTLTATSSAVNPLHDALLTFPVPPDATVVNPTGTTRLDKTALRMPMDLTKVLFAGASERDRCSVMQTPRDAQHDGDSVSMESNQTNLSHEVHGKHTDLATLLAHSRLEMSHVIDNDPTVLHIARGAAAAAAQRREGTVVVDATHVEHTINSTTSSGEGSETGAAEESTCVAVSTPGRRVVHRAPSSEHPYNVAGGGVRHAGTAAETDAERERRQRRQTILDVPNVAYVESPDISTHIDRSEAQRKEREHDIFVMRWAERGLMWQRQEREAQLYEEQQARLRCGGPVRMPAGVAPPRPGMTVATPVRRSGASPPFQRPPRANAAYAPAPAAPRGPAFPQPSRRRH